MVEDRNFGTAGGTARRIERRKDGRGRVAQVRRELGEILHGGMDDVPVYAPDCPRAGPERCSRHCPDIPRVLSSDPENHPLESRIAPLVYEIKRLEVFDPCWSCAGHDGADGALWKIPRVWFYCRSVVHLRVLADALKELHLDRRLSVPWRVVPQGDALPAPDGKALRAQAERALEEPGSQDRTIVRRYRKDPSPLVRDSVRGWRTGRLDLVLAGDFDLI